MDSPITWAVALDGGTTNTRARLIDVVAGRVVAVARRAAGVRDAVLSATTGADLPPLEHAVREAIGEVLRAEPSVRPDLIVAAGMLTADVGLVGVPHVVAPAGLDELARGSAVYRLPAVVDLPILFVPGVRTPAGDGIDGWTQADVMRGEECESLGAWLHAGRSSPPPVAMLWPGSHTKLVAVDQDGRITASHTTLAGEMLHSIAHHTLLAASLPAELPETPDAEAMSAGARLVTAQGLGRAAFLIRVAALGAALDLQQRAAFWIGAVVADDVEHLARHPILVAARSVLVGGRNSLRDLYVDLLQQRLSGSVQALEATLAENASAFGALAVALRHREIEIDEGRSPVADGLTD
jgi:2-dehydro-3-deoxygalactonokinase